MISVITKDTAPALGNVRTLGSGDAIVLRPDATQRKDWARYQHAIGEAVSRGAGVHHVRPEGDVQEVTS